MNINHNFQNVADSYLFSTIAKKVAEYQQENPKADIIRLGIGDVTMPVTARSMRWEKRKPFTATARSRATAF